MGNQFRCKEEKSVRMVTHTATLKGPCAGRSCELPAGKSGKIEHTFTNESIYWVTCVTSATPDTGALSLTAGPQSESVKVPPAGKGLFKVKPESRTTHQLLDHAKTSIALPHDASVEFSTKVGVEQEEPHSPFEFAISVRLTEN